MTQLDALAAPCVAHLETLVLASGYVHLDATPVDRELPRPLDSLR